ncbi:hypothetical protein A6456_38125 [Paraburkholderia tropica]|nr:hypothetical protein A6456_38125 [Paraburkholderia tropica]
MLIGRSNCNFSRPILGKQRIQFIEQRILWQAFQKKSLENYLYPLAEGIDIVTLKIFDFKQIIGIKVRTYQADRPTEYLEYGGAHISMLDRI